MDKMKNFWFSILGFIFLFSVQVIAQENVAVATKVDGEVLLKRAKSDKYSTEVQIGTRIHLEDKVKTGAKGYLVLVFLDDKSQLKIRPNSEITMQGTVNQQEGAIQKRIEMDRGNLKAEVAKQRRGKFIIATPTSVASVKGTDFYLKMLAQFDQLLVNSGTVIFYNKVSGDSVSVSGGYGATSSPDGSLQKFVLVGVRGTINSMDETQGRYSLENAEITTQPTDTTIAVPTTLWTSDQTLYEGNKPTTGSEISALGSLREDGSIDAMVVGVSEMMSESQEHELKIEFENSQGEKKTLEIQYKEE